MSGTGLRCPFCGQIATIQDEDIHDDQTTLRIENATGRVTLVSRFIVCPNPECSHFTLSLALWRSKYNHQSSREELPDERPLHVWKLIPQSGAKVLPPYVPAPIVEDYVEACAIKDLSPKASATLARRCLQGMIRDFWKVVRGTLNEELKALEDKVDPVTWSAIDAVRTVGNIGAHMEKDIDLIVEVDPDEAGMLIELIETLVEDWYVDRHNRQQRMGKVIALGQAKREAKKGPSTPT